MARQSNIGWGVPVATVALLAAIVVHGCTLGSFRYRSDGLDLLFAACGWLALLGIAVARLRHGGAIGRAMLGLALFVTMSILTTLVSAVLSRGQLPYVDDTLARIDRWLAPGFDWPATMLALAQRPRLLAILEQVYVSLNWQPLALFAAMALRMTRVAPATFVTAWSLALLACVLPFHWLPAVGPYSHYGIAFDAMGAMRVHLAWDIPVAMEALRDGSLTVLSPRAVVGIVSMPSFHACAAVLLGWSFAGSRLLRWIFVPLNAAMLVSAVPVGGHYLSDVVAGAMLAIVSIVAVRRLERAGPAWSWPRRLPAHAPLGGAIEGAYTPVPSRC